ncbi:MAG: tyrosine-type recombinase/integrase [Candidatus Omnitrophota bacterium]|nr:tyrosine-type recombinase/integrase [bacterium]
MENNIRLVFNADSTRGISRYTLVKSNGQSVDESNDFLNKVATLGLSPNTVRTYAYDLLNFFRWLSSANIKFKDITKSLLLDYIRYQHESFRGENKITPATINHRLTVVRSLYQYHFNQAIPSGTHMVRPKNVFTEYKRVIPFFPHRFSSTRRSVRVKMPRKVVKPLTRIEVARFMDSFKTWRDIAITAFMLLCGLRSREVITIKLEDVQITEDQVHILGKGRRERVVPLPADLVTAIKRYIQLERPENSDNNLFVALKGPHRGKPLTSSGLRTLYRYHRKISGIYIANPHRFRHTFGANMARAGIPLPALMMLMGHSAIKTTIGYTNISLNDIRDEFHRVVDKLYSREIENGPNE